MIVTPGSGPVGTPTAKDGAGFRARRATRYAVHAGEAAEASLPPVVGSPRVTGRTVTAAHTLRVFIHPELDAGLRWGATFVAVDLEFADGTRLSALDPHDQYGTPATPRGQGDGKILSSNQWNDVQIPLAAAAGRTIQRVLLRADVPSLDDDGADEGADDAAGAEGAAPPEYVGWIDGPYLEQAAPLPPASDPVAWVDTRRGTHASGDFSRGNNLPLTAWPNGFVFFTPATNARTDRWVYEYARANGPDNRPRLQALAISHQPSPWMGDRCQFFLMPLLGEDPDAGPSARALGFDHDDETARPDLYEVGLDHGVRMRIAPTDHGGVCEVEFGDDAPAQRHLLLEGPEAMTGIDASSAVLDGSFRAWVDPQPGGAADPDGTTRMYVVGEIDPKPAHVEPARGANAGAPVLTFEPGTTAVTIRLATSFIGDDQARRSYGHEIAGRTVRQVRSSAHAAWTRRLRVIEADGATPPQLRTLYGNLYRLSLYPNSQWENAGTPQRPQPVHASPVLPVKGRATATRTNAQVRPGKLHVNHGFWDTYRTAWPAYALLYPALAAELADGFIQQFREGGWISRWSSPGYADCMTGTSSDIAFADLAVKGIALPDLLAAYDAGLVNATVTPPTPRQGRKGSHRSVFTGYVDTDTDESVSWALEAHINDAGLAALAEILAEHEDTPDERRRTLAEEAAYLRARSGNYVLLFDTETGFFRGRRPDGAFSESAEEFDPLSWGGDFTETDGWNFAFHAPHDGEGLAALHGGLDGLLEALDEFFTTPEKADRKGTYGHVIHEMVEAREVRMGQFGVSNQPAHHIPFLYHHAGAPERAMAIVREVQRRLFAGEQIGQGYPGDEDNGEMSAWWLLTALGLYPLQLGTTRYHVVAPLFERARVRPLDGEPFTITARGQAIDHPYVTGLRVGGDEHVLTAIDHHQLRGEIEVDLAGEPSGWGEIPPSPTPQGEYPQVLRDLLPAVADEPLLDDDSRTERAFARSEAVIELPALPEAEQARFLTLTSGEQGGGDPSAWRLEGSADGASWHVLDERTGEQFRWRRQTRAFEIADPRPCTRHRLVITAGAGPLRIAQIELLALGAPD